MPLEIETDPHQALNKLQASRWPMCACHKSDYSIDQNPDGVPIFAEDEKEDDFNDSFDNEKLCPLPGLEERLRAADLSAD